MDTSGGLLSLSANDDTMKFNIEGKEKGEQKNCLKKE